MANKKNEKRNLVRQRKILKAKGPLNAFVPNPLVYQQHLGHPLCALYTQSFGN